mgnify:CR=1 FL=1
MKAIKSEARINFSILAKASKLIKRQRISYRKSGRPKKKCKNEDKLRWKTITNKQTQTEWDAEKDLAGGVGRNGGELSTVFYQLSSDWIRSRTGILDWLETSPHRSRDSINLPSPSQTHITSLSLSLSVSLSLTLYVCVASIPRFFSSCYIETERSLCIRVGVLGFCF